MPSANNLATGGRLGNSLSLATMGKLGTSITETIKRKIKALAISIRIGLGI